MNTLSPYEQMKFIRDVIKDRTDKSQATFFSVELESFGNVTPLVEKENGALFYDTIIQYLTRYDVAALIIKLYHGKSHNIKDPFQTFRIILKKSSNVSLSGIEKRDDTLQVHSETVISPEKHFQTLAENNFNLLRLQYDPAQVDGPNSKAEIIKETTRELTETEKIRKQIKDFINETLDASDDGTLRLYYEIIKITGTNLKLLQMIFLSVKKWADSQTESAKTETESQINGSVVGKGKEEEEQIDDS